MSNSVKRQSRKVGVAGGFINQMMGNNSSVPKVGEGATTLSYSDRHAYEVIEVSEDGNSCVIRPMNCKFIGEAYGDERYEYSSNLDHPGAKIEWNNKKKCWGFVYTTVEIQKSLFNKLFKEYSYDWRNHLPVPYESLLEEDNDPSNPYDSFKVVKGVTKEYKKFNKVSIIFGVMEEYRDPSF